MQKLIYLMGGTCCGKSTFIKHAKEYYGDKAGFVEVGKRLREKYPPEYFKGSAAPDHTEKEAIELYRTEAAMLLEDRELVFVDGQPRRASQVEPVLDSFGNVPKIFILFSAPAEVQAVRAGQRFVQDSKSFELAIARIENDRKQGYDCLVELLKNNMWLRGVDTGAVPEMVWARGLGIVEGISFRIDSYENTFRRALWEKWVRENPEKVDEGAEDVDTQKIEQAVSLQMEVWKRDRGLIK